MPVMTFHCEACKKPILSHDVHGGYAFDDGVMSTSTPTRCTIVFCNSDCAASAGWLDRLTAEAKMSEAICIAAEDWWRNIGRNGPLPHGHNGGPEEQLAHEFYLSGFAAGVRWGMKDPRWPQSFSLPPEAVKMVNDALDSIKKYNKT